jgi:hypothetical protein
MKIPTNGWLMQNHVNYLFSIKLNVKGNFSIVCNGEMIMIYGNKWENEFHLSAEEGISISLYQKEIMMDISLKLITESKPTPNNSVAAANLMRVKLTDVKGWQLSSSPPWRFISFDWLWIAENYSRKTFLTLPVEYRQLSSRKRGEPFFLNF